MELVWGVLPILALLACPLMMGCCLLSMRKMGSATPPLPATQQEPRRPEQQVTALQQHLTAILAKLTTLHNDTAQASWAARHEAENQMFDAARGSAHAPRRPA